MKVWVILLAIYLFLMGLGAFVAFPTVVLYAIGILAIATGVFLLLGK